MAIGPSRRTAAAGALVVFLSACRTTSPPSPVTSPPAPAPISYTLPKTTMVVELQAERVSEARGRYCDFLDLFFPELEPAAACQAKEKDKPDPLPGDRLVAAKSRMSVQGYGLTLKGVPDSTRKHDMSFDDSWHVERSDSLSLTEGGTLTGAEMQRTDRTAEIVLGVFSNVAKIAGRFLFGGGDKPLTDKPDAPPWERVAALRENFSFIAKERQNKYTALWSDTSGTGRARLALAARSYATLVADLATLNTVLGGVGAQGAATLIPELRKQVSDRLADDFVGSRTKHTWTPIYEFTPDFDPKAAASPTAQTYRLFSFAGCGVTSEAMQPVKNTVGALWCADASGATPVELTFVVKTASRGPASRLSTPDTPDPSGVLFVIRPEPVLANVSGSCRAAVTVLEPSAPGGTPAIADQSTQPCTIVDQAALLAQWGVQASIPKAGKDYAYAVTLYEATGAVKTIKLASKAALDAATIDAAFGIATTLLDAKDAADAEARKKADAAAAAADELAVLTRSRQILDEKAKIKKLCAELGLTTCGS